MLYPAELRGPAFAFIDLAVRERAFRPAGLVGQAEWFYRVLPSQGAVGLSVRHLPWLFPFTAHSAYFRRIRLDRNNFSEPNFLVGVDVRWCREC